MRWLPLALVMLVLVGILVVQDPAAVGLGTGRPATDVAVPADERVGPCRLGHVVDGDTLDLRCEEGEERVRLLRIDTPEREEPGYREARRALERLVRGRQLFLVFEAAGQPLRDRYGRLLAYVYADELNTSLEMVRQGWSALDARFGAGRFAPVLEAAEREARAAGRGLWSAQRGSAVPGAPARAAARSASTRPCAMPALSVPLVDPRGEHPGDREESV